MSTWEKGEAEVREAGIDALRDELRFVIHYLGHHDQDANHAWMVRRIRAVLDGKDPNAVQGWTEHDGVRPPRAPDEILRSAEAALLELVQAARGLHDGPSAHMPRNVMTFDEAARLGKQVRLAFAAKEKR